MLLESLSLFVRLNQLSCGYITRHHKLHSTDIFITGKERGNPLGNVKEVIMLMFTMGSEEKIVEKVSQLPHNHFLLITFTEPIIIKTNLPWLS